MTSSAVIVFPGSNCDRDSFTVMQAAGLNPRYVWHHETTLPKGCDLVVLPGGFSYGDYLRCGAIAAHSPIMAAVKKHADAGGYVLGICNGFQMLCETGILPGVLMRNRDLKFICKPVHLRVETNSPRFMARYKTGDVITVPIAHADGNYRADDETLAALEGNGQIAFRYVDNHGDTTDHANPNGACAHIAGVLNTRKNVLGMMPHPERHAEQQLGGLDGAAMFAAFAG
jgi:phosphoribosylformylglycinamidine synthase I